jgi:outer membrane protein OmpA-like peptidoglycan-associated protein
MKRGFILFFLLASFLTVTGQSTGKYQIKFLEINKSNSDYGVAILDENKLIFTSADEDPQKERNNFNSRKDLYVGDIDYDGEIKNVKPVVKKMNHNFNQTGLTYTKDRKTVYFAGNKYWKKKKKQNNPKNKKLQLYKASVNEDGSWDNIEKLSFNKKGIDISHPVLSSDNKQLYFASDMKPSHGKTDIFVVDIREDGSYSEPRNLGTFVNTEGVETTPFISHDNILYFSSDGHPGEGKLDVFAVEVYKEGTSEPYHLSAPINSINDDFAYIVNQDNNQGFFTSNRLQGEGYNDLYSFTLEEDVRPGECFITVDGRVRDKETLELLSGATVDLYSLDGELLESVSTYQDGTYKFTVSCAKEYMLKASSPNYKEDEKRIEILEENYHTALHTNMNLNRLNEDKPIPAAALQPIYYEFDKSTITADAAEKMDKIIEIMKANPDLIVEASSFTDSRGSDNYNLALSQRRAKAAVEYLISKGVDATRIQSKGYGEDKLINQCVNGVNCDEASHQLNRRTEFNFVNNPQSRAEGQSSKVSPAKKPEREVLKSKKDVKESRVAGITVPETIQVEMTQPETLSQKESSDEARVSQTSSEKAIPVKATKSRTVEVATETLTIGDIDMKAPELKPVIMETPVAETESQIAETDIIDDQEETKAEDANSESRLIEEAAVIAAVTPKKPKAKKTKKTEPVKHTYQARPEEAKKEIIAENEPKNDMIAEEREEIAAIEREKASYRTEEKEFAKVDKAEVKEAVVINYNSTIVATNPESNKVLNYIGTEKTKMIEQLNELEKQYEEAIPKYTSVSDSLSAEKQRIAQVIDKAETMEETGWSNIIEFKNNVLHFKRRYRELLVENNRGSKTSGDRGPGSIQIIEEESTEVAQIEPVKEEPTKTTSVKEELAVDQVSVTAMKKNGKGKYQVTSNANKTDLIKVTFKLKSQKKGEIGRKEAHLVMQNPEGSVAEAKGIFTIKDSQTESKYTDHAIINYNNHDVDVTMFVQRKGNQFEKGVYPIKLFVEGELMSVSNLNLQNAN